ncbi:MAG TPA: glycosyltransferase family 4 protein [Chloroflexota bacterium]
MPPAGLIAIALGEAPRAAVESAIRRHFGPQPIDWLDRRDLRRRPLALTIALLRRRYESAVLVTTALDQPRLRLTSMLLALPRARTRWRIDLGGNREAWTPAMHLRLQAFPAVRHAFACLLAAALAEPLLGLVARLLEPRAMALRRPTRVLYLRSQLWLGLEGGGSVAHTAGVIAGLERAGVEVQVVSSDRLAGVNAPTRVARPEMWFDGWRRELEDLAYNVAFLSAAVRVARHFRPEAIYQRHTAFNCAGAVLSRLLGVPLVLEFNSSELWKGRFWGGLRLAGAAARVERINLQAADRVIVVSRVLRDELVASGVPGQKIVVNPNGVDTSVYRPDLGGDRVRRQLGLGSDVVVGFSGTFGAWHGVPTLARALPLVLAARPHVRWLLIGDGPLRATVDEAVERHGLGDRVARPGLVPHANVPEYLAACDVLVSPHGRQADGGEFFGSPTKLFEYMAVGRPIVASRVGQITEVLADDESGLLVAPDDADALARAIVRLADDACLRLRLGRAARDAAEARHTWGHNAQRILDCLGAT